MVVRDRVQTYPMHPAGKSTLTGWADIEAPYDSTLMTSRCIDVVDGTRNSHPLSISHSHFLWYQITGNSHNIPGAPGYHWDYGGYPRIGDHYINPPATAEPSTNSSLSTALARTNPNRPTQDLLVAFAELRDLPKMLKGIGDTFIKKHPSRAKFTRKTLPKTVASGTLAIEFGWLPLVRDLLGLLDFEANVEKKLNMLRNMASKGGSSGSTVVWEDVSDNGSHALPISSLWNESNYGYFHWESTRKKWVSTRWVPTADIPSRNSQAERNLAVRLATGSDISLAAMWELMPWSWLIDWFSNIGDLASLSRNTLPVSNQGSCLMLRTESRVRYLGPVVGSGTGRYQLYFPKIAPVSIKERWVLDGLIPLPEFNLPFLDGKQLGILSSLTLARIKL